MKILQRPILTTILFGLVCGISFIPLNRVLNTIFIWPSPVCLALWLYSAGYSLLLWYWSKNKFMPILYPLLILFMAAFLVTSVTSFFILALPVMSWIRSAICFSERGRVKLAVEILLGFVGSNLIAVFPPASPAAWALSIWMFFLLQSLYFAIFDGKLPDPKNESETELDPFERASRQVEDILSAGEVL